MTTRLACVLSERDLPLPELQAARLDGEVYMIGEGFAPIDEHELARHRAQSLSAVMAPRFIAERMTAAWVHGARAHPPAMHEFCVAYTARVRAPSGRLHHLREVVISDDETVTLGGITVTSPLRTAIDIIRGEQFGTQEREVVTRLLDGARLSVARCRVEIERRHKLAGKALALRRVAGLEAKDVDAQLVTR